MENYTIRTPEQISEIVVNGAFRDDIKIFKNSVKIREPEGDKYISLSKEQVYSRVISLFEYLNKRINMHGKTLLEVYGLKKEQIVAKKKHLEKIKDSKIKNKNMLALESEKVKLKEDITGTYEKLKNSKRPNISVYIPKGALIKLSDIHNSELILNMVILRQRFKRLYKDPTNQDEEYNKVLKEIDKYYFDIKNKVAEETFFQIIYFFIKDTKELCQEIKESYKIEKFSDEDILNIIKEDIGQENFKKCFGFLLAAFKDRSNLIKKLEEQGFFTRQEVKENSIDDMFYVWYKEKRQPNILRYCKTEDLFKLYDEKDENGKKYINSDTLLKYTTVHELLSSSEIPCDKLFEFLTTKKRNSEYPLIGIILGRYMAGHWNLEQFRTLVSYGYVEYSEIIELYNFIEDKTLIVELLEKDNDKSTKIDPQTMVNIFSSEIVFNEYFKSSISAEENFFYKTTLKNIYHKQGKDLEQDLLNYIDEQYKDDKDKRDNLLIDLYAKQMLTRPNTQITDISEEKFMEYYRAHESDTKLLIMFYNNALISNFAVIEEVEENIDSVLELYKLGLDLSVLQGFCTTSKIIELIRNQQINASELYKLKDDISVEEVRNLYINSKLNYAELYILADNGAITKEVADEINGEFDLKNALETLKKSGIRGKQGLQERTSNSNISSKNLALKSKKIAKKPGGLSPVLKGELFGVLGAGSDMIDFNEDHPFHGCSLIPIIDKKIGIIEGDGRTCVVPLKIAIEYIENPGSADDIFGNATRRGDVYGNKKYVSSINHTKHWGTNLIKAVVERSSELTSEDTKKIRQSANEIIVNDKPLLEALQDSYMDRRKAINR